MRQGELSALALPHRGRPGGQPARVPVAGGAAHQGVQGAQGREEEAGQGTKYTMEYRA